MSDNYDAILFVSFGAPEKPEDVMPFLRNVTRGRGIPDERLTEVAENYQIFGGRSPLNEQNQAIISALGALLKGEGPALPIYWGNRNWHPFLTEAFSEMKKDGIKRALAFVTSAYSSYSGCRQYRENIEQAKIEAGAEEIKTHKIRVFYDHPQFIAANAENLQRVLDQIPFAERAAAQIVFTAHSLPLAMANNCDYEAQLRETCALVCELVGLKSWSLAFQSRSGAPHVPWLEPDINDFLRESARKGVKTVIVHPIGFLSDHQEIVFDLDTQAKATAESLGMNLYRVETVGTNPRFVRMIRELILEQTSGTAPRFLGSLRQNKNYCGENCCLFVHGRPAK